MAETKKYSLEEIRTLMRKTPKEKKPLPEPGLEEEGFFDILAPTTKKGLSYLREKGVPESVTKVAEFMTPSSPLELLPPAYLVSKAQKAKRVKKTVDSAKDVDGVDLNKMSAKELEETLFDYEPWLGEPKGIDYEEVAFSPRSPYYYENVKGSLIMGKQKPAEELAQTRAKLTQRLKQKAKGELDGLD